MGRNGGEKSNFICMLGMEVMIEMDLKIARKIILFLAINFPALLTEIHRANENYFSKRTYPNLCG